MLSMLLAIAVAPPLRPPPAASARVSIHILQPARASEPLWHSAKQRSDRLITDEKGRTLRLRTIDFE